MIGAILSTGLLDYRLYNLDLRLVSDAPTHLSNVVLQAIWTSEGVAHNLWFDEGVGDDTFDPSAVTGNDNGKLKWGSGGFEQSIRNISIDCTERHLVVDLSERLGIFYTTTIARHVIGAEGQDGVEFGDEVLGGKVLFPLGYDDHSAGPGMSVLRNRGLEAYCVMGTGEDGRG
ncbi:hypothetical protein FRC10_004058 [Ceratobasidium sp. 414]|nr:hypothetical protein FRC10_004058 [Ceratobasidium sp. 414]